MNRRRYLALFGSSATVGLAGCNSGGDSTAEQPEETAETEEPAGTSTGPAAFEEVTVDGPTSVTVGAEATLTVSVTNTGGQSGEFSDTLTAEGGFAAPETAVSIPDVPAGETASTEVGPFSFEAVQSLTFSLAEADASHELSVEPYTSSLGGTHELAGGDLAITASLRGYQPSMFREYEGQAPGYNTDTVTRTDLFQSAAGTVFAAVEFEVENRTTESVTMDPGAFQFGSQTALTELPDGLQSDLLEGDSITGTEVAAQTAASGWMLFEADREELSGGPTVGWNRAEAASPEVVWTGDSAPSLPQFFVEGATFPDSLEITETGTATVTVTNGGDAAGTFRGLCQRQVDDEWWTTARVSQQVEAGASAEIEVNVREEYVGPTAYQITPGGNSGTIEFTRATRAFGEPYVAPNGIEYAVSIDQFADSYVYNELGAETTSEADGVYAITTVATENTTTEDGATRVDEDAFAAVVDGETYADFYPGEILEPVDTDNEYFGDNLNAQMDAGATYSGWTIHDVPAGTTRADLGIQLATDDIEVIWRAESQ